MSLKLTGNGLFESSRMMLPEHKEAYNEFRKNLDRKERPHVDEQRLAELSYQFAEAMNEEATVRIRIYDLFQDRWITGKVERIDPLQARMKLVQEDESRWIKLAEIIDLVVE
ncbi:MAG: YolD-like family protein [Candidatus Pristimantibacillus lignocellulolyticus]|uniref:YolD-like family protein n=1 Tax=Candidatus Pristimantibacillus lignocellulolyticus TaxID=2994561 RepID=A0A9J6ZBB2_9BACL|nr:MAG: YolD-like family protein [Candidatus Pristimantibacillus lignocellulolyticus]